MVRKFYEVVDPYALAQFKSLWQVVVHASDVEDDRIKLYHEAHAAMVKNHRWGEYGMVFHTTKSGGRLHVGFRFANPKDWFKLGDDGHVDGPFSTKAVILRRLCVKTSKTVDSGIYLAKDEDQEYTLFTRDRAEAVGLAQEELP